MTQATILPDRLKRFSSVHLRLGAGGGANGQIDVCALQAADWLAGGDGKTDKPKCVCHVIREYLIKLNDSDMFFNHRDDLKPIVIRAIGSRGSLRTRIGRAKILAGFAKSIAKFAFGYAAECSGEYVGIANIAAHRAALYATFSAKLAEMSTGKYAVHPNEYARYTAQNDAYNAACADSAAKCAEFAATCAECAGNHADEYSAETRAMCIACLKSMIDYTGDQA